MNQEITMALPEVEFLRYLSDLIANRVSKEDQSQTQEQQPIVVNVNNGGNTDGENGSGDVNPADVESPIDDCDTFIPPLQAKIEMMKKLTGVQPKDQTLKQSQEEKVQEEKQSHPSATRKQFKMIDMFDDDIIG